MKNYSGPIATNRLRRSFAFACAWGSGAGLLIAIVATTCDMMHFRVGLFQSLWAFYLVYLPVLGLIASCLLWRGAAGKPENSFSNVVEPQTRSHGRNVEECTAIGFVGGLIATAPLLLCRGWPCLGYVLPFNLLVFPFAGLLVGLKLRRAVGEPRWSWRHLRFNLRTMMLLIAYLALWLGLSMAAWRIGRAAIRYDLRYTEAVQLAYAQKNVILPKLQEEVLVRWRNAKELREGTIAAGLQPGQKNFLKSLNTAPNVKPEDRKYRYQVMADGEELYARDCEKSAQEATARFDYFSELAVKYGKARREPWRPVEPDPPLPTRW